MDWRSLPDLIEVLRRSSSSSGQVEAPSSLSMLRHSSAASIAIAAGLYPIAFFWKAAKRTKQNKNETKIN